MKTLIMRESEISLNGLEYLLTEDGEVMEFASRQEAVAFLEEAGLSKKEIEDEIVFVEE